MSTVRRLTRRRIEDFDPIIHAWDNAMPPPPEASEPSRRGEVIAVVFFRWAERRPAWTGHHPHLTAWLAALDTCPQ